MKKAHSLEFQDPKRLLDEAASEGYIAAVFADYDEALKFAKRVRRTIQNGAQQVRAKLAGKPMLRSDDYIGAEAWEPLHVQLTGPKVAIINVKHPNGRAHLPKFKIERQ